MTTIGLRLLSDKRVAEPLEKVSRELRQAKAIGQLTLLTIGSKIKSANAPATETSSATVTPTPVDTEVGEPNCIENYGELTASQIVPLLDGLTAAERANVLAYEMSTRQRRTILAALAKFQS